MRKIDTESITILAICVVFISIFGMLMVYDYSTKKLEAEQPKYFIEFKGNIYELKGVY